MVFVEGALMYMFKAGVGAALKALVHVVLTWLCEYKLPEMALHAVVYLLVVFFVRQYDRVVAAFQGISKGGGWLSGMADDFEQSVKQFRGKIEEANRVGEGYAAVAGMIMGTALCLGLNAFLASFVRASCQTVISLVTTADPVIFSVQAGLNQGVIDGLMSLMSFKGWAELSVENPVAGMAQGLLMSGGGFGDDVVLPAVKHMRLKKDFAKDVVGPAMQRYELNKAFGTTPARTFATDVVAPAMQRINLEKDAAAQAASVKAFAGRSAAHAAAVDVHAGLQKTREATTKVHDFVTGIATSKTAGAAMVAMIVCGYAFYWFTSNAKYNKALQKKMRNMQAVEAKQVAKVQKIERDEPVSRKEWRRLKRRETDQWEEVQDASATKKNDQEKKRKILEAPLALQYVEELRGGGKKQPTKKAIL